MTEHPITPPPELVQQWFLSARAMPVDQWVTDVATQAARWGADQELEACVEWLADDHTPVLGQRLRAARRPKPLSLKQQALEVLDDASSRLDAAHENIIRRALELLDD